MKRVRRFAQEAALPATLYPYSFWFLYINSHYESWQAVGILFLAEKDTNLYSSTKSVAVAILMKGVEIFTEHDKTTGKMNETRRKMTT